MSQFRVFTIGRTAGCAPRALGRTDVPAPPDLAPALPTPRTIPEHPSTKAVREQMLKSIPGVQK